METTSIAIPENSSSHSNLVVEERAAPSIKKERNSDNRAFSRVLEQAKKLKLVKKSKQTKKLEQWKGAEQVDSGAEDKKMEEEAPRGVRVGKKRGSGLDNSKFEFKFDGKKLDFEIKEKHLSRDKSKAQVKQRMLNESNSTPDRVVSNEVLQLAGESNSRNQKSDLSDNSVGRAIVGKRKSNQTSIAPRVEIQDRRADASKAYPISWMRRSRVDHVGEEVDRELSLENRPMTADMEIEISPRHEGKNSLRSAAMEFARKLDAQAGNEIVKQIKIVLNRASAGELRINLKPENLGQVRVHIHLEDNRLRGRFFAESTAAREILKGALDGLQAKLLESGFSSAELKMAWDNSSSDFGFNNGNPRGRKTSRKNAILEFENSVPISVPDELSENLVNLVV